MEYCLSCNTAGKRMQKRNAEKDVLKKSAASMV